MELDWIGCASYLVDPKGLPQFSSYFQHGFISHIGCQNWLHLCLSIFHAYFWRSRWCKLSLEFMSGSPHGFTNSQSRFSNIHVIFEQKDAITCSSEQTTNSETTRPVSRKLLFFFSKSLKLSLIFYIFWVYFHSLSNKNMFWAD